MEFLKDFGWHIVTLICVFGFFLFFSKALRARIDKLKEVHIAGVKFIAYPEAAVDRPKPLQIRRDARRTLAVGNARWQNTGNLFWLGHDLMWTMQMALRGAEPAIIAYGLRQSWHHLISLGLAESPAGIQLKKVINDPAMEDNSAWNRSKRDSFAVSLDGVLDQIGLLAERNQPDFEPGDSSTASERLGS